MIYLPLEHIEQRYTTYMDEAVREYLDRKGIEYKYIEPKVFSGEIVNGSFLDSQNTCYRQFYQFCKLIELIKDGKVRDNETIFTTDVWNFALLCVPYINFFSNLHLKVRGVLHAGSFTDTDFVRQMERIYKGFEESLFDICEKIYVASDFIKNDVIQKRYVNPDKIVVCGGIPLDFKHLSKYKTTGEKENLIVFNGRNVDEKQPYLFDLLQKKLPQYRYINTQKQGLNKDEYYKVLSKAKCVVSYALQENFGIGVQEATYLGAIPCVPNRLVYKEQFDERYRYDTFEQSVDLVERIMNNQVEQTLPVFLNNDILFDKWFDKIND